MEIKKVGNIVGGGKAQGGNTYLPSGISPTLLNGMSHGNVMPFVIDVRKIVEIRKVDTMYEQNTMPNRAEQSRAA